MKKLLICLLCLLLAALTGCRNAQEINDMSVLSGAAFDLDASTGDYLIAAEIINQSSGGGEDKAGKTITARGENPGEALENCLYHDSREALWSHARVFVLSREAAQEGIWPFLDMVLHDSELRLSIDLLIADLPEAKGVWELDTGSENMKAFDLESMLMTAREYGTAAPIKVYQAAELLNTEGIQLTVPLLSTDPEGRAFLSGTAVFQGDRLAGSLNPEETLFFLLLRDRMEEGHFTFGEDSVTVLIQKEKTRLLLEGAEDAPALLVTLRLTAEALQRNGKELSAIKEDLETALEEGCRSLIHRGQQEFMADIFGFGEAIKRQEPALWEELGKDWDTVSFPGLPVKVQCNVELS